MQKVYLLLRNNQQTGPFSLEEIIQFDLKPYDLIWIEGKSAGWYYPQEIKALHPHLTFVKQQEADTKVQTSPAASLEKPTQKKIFVSMPVNQIQEEATKQPSALFTAVASESFESPLPTNQTEPELKTTYAKSLEEVEADYMNWTYQKKTKRKQAVSKKGAIAACLLVGVAFAGWLAIKSFTSSTANKNEQVALSPVQNQVPADSVSETITIQGGIKSSAKKPKEPKGEAIKKEITILKKGLPKEDNHKVVLNNNSTANNEYEGTLPGKEETKVTVEKKDPEPTADAPKGQKKKLGEKFLDLFKKKPEENKSGAAKPVEEENGERRSARRETNLVAQVTIKFEVPNDWMMGIKGAKASLTNRSSETIVKATIEVQYYNEDNELLQTKTLNFSNIGAKKTATLPVPDHSLADHLDYKIISAQGAAEPFARL